MMEGKNKILCVHCKKVVSYQIHSRPGVAWVKGKKIEYEDNYGVCDECHKEVKVPELEDRMKKLIKNLYVCQILEGARKNA